MKHVRYRPPVIGQTRNMAAARVRAPESKLVAFIDDLQPERQLYPYQGKMLEMFESLPRESVIAWGRRAGKTGAANRLIKAMKEA